MNPAFQLINMIRNGGNPQQLALSMLQSMAGNNPMIKNLVSLAQNNDSAGLEQIARNLLAQQGLDFDQEYSSLAQQLGGTK